MIVSHDFLDGSRLQRECQTKIKSAAKPKQLTTPRVSKVLQFKKQKPTHIHAHERRHQAEEPKKSSSYHPLSTLQSDSNYRPGN